MYYHILNSKNSTIILYIINQIYLNTYSSLIYSLLKKHANFRWSVGEKPFPKLIPKISPKPKKIIIIYGILRTSKIYIKNPPESPFLGISEGLNHLLKKFALFHLLCHFFCKILFLFLDSFTCLKANKSLDRKI